MAEHLNRTENSQEVIKGTEKLTSRSASEYFDYALAQNLGYLHRQFDVYPGFSYYEEEYFRDYNAAATDAPMLGRADGTVLLGLRMVAHLMRLEIGPAAAVAAVCAHEFGHILAMKKKINDKLITDIHNPFRGEQFADFMSGYVAGLRKREDPDFPSVVFGTTLSDLGSSTRGTHGTREERGEAVVEGFKQAYTEHASLDQAVESGYRFSMSR